MAIEGEEYEVTVRISGREVLTISPLGYETAVVLLRSLAMTLISDVEETQEVRWQRRQLTAYLGDVRVDATIAPLP